MKLTIPKGLFDILPYGELYPWQKSTYWQYLEETIRSLTKQYGFLEIRTPVFEQAEVFSRGVGATSDIIHKEMYLFSDRKQRQLALRPEGTSAVIRAFIEKNLYTIKKVHKLFYIAPMFRYERPQAGRYRQHHQFGVEALGVHSPEQDAEVIDMLFTLYSRLGLKKIKVGINSIGDLPSRTAYKEALKKFLSPHLEKMSQESQERFSKNPLRILDSKDPQDQPFLQGAPSILDSLNTASKDYFHSLLSLLDPMQLPYEVIPQLVRGLDYYNHTVFEITSEELGAQNALGGGGRYDGFTSLFGGPSLPGIGFGTGMERILQALLQQKAKLPTSPKPDLYWIPLGEAARKQALFLATKLRRKRICCEVDLSEAKLKQALSYASSQQIPYVAILGENELAKNKVQLKDMHQNKTYELSQEALISQFLKEESYHV